MSDFFHAARLADVLCGLGRILAALFMLLSAVFLIPLGALWSWDIACRRRE